jgi:3-hydroxymyristoyl/3-hydroxydecanoyl-(acyl carrier protein) dehydratase
MLQNEYRYSIPANHPSLDGHFPGNPIIPGVVILDKTLQSMTQHTPAHSYKIEAIKFLQPFTPPATLTIKLVDKENNKIHFSAMNQDKMIAKGIVELILDSNV